MGVLHRGTDKAGKPVAIKTLTEEQAASERNVRCLRAEFALAGGIRHPNIVRMLDLIEHDGIPYLIMEFIPGEDVRALLNRGRIPLAEALELAKGLAMALQALHERPGGRPVVHGDVKPENLMVRKAAGPLRKERLVLVDFGTAVTSREGRGVLSKAVSFVKEKLKGPRPVGGSSLYMAPEQAAGEAEAIDPRTDLYSAGAVMFELFTGRPPFLNTVDEKSFEDHGRVSLSAQEELLQSHYGQELRNMHRVVTPPSPRRFNPDLPEGLEHLVLHCLQKRPEDRPQRALDLLTALTSFRIDGGGALVPTRLPGARAAQAKPAYLLQIIGGPLKGKERVLRGAAVKAGRAVDAGDGISLPEHDRTASGEHALFQHAGDCVEVHDLGSSNGTFVNGRKVAKAKLKDGDKVKLGQTVIRVTGYGR